MKNDPRSLQTEDPALSPSTRERTGDAQSSDAQSLALSGSSSTLSRLVLGARTDLDGVTLNVEDANPEILPPRDRCANCGTPRAGRYCATCGQRHLDGRLSLRQLVRDFLARIFDLESGLLHTVWRLTVTPGSVPRDYVVGRRSRYVRPGTYFVLISALSVLLFPLMKTAYVAYLQGAFDPILASGSLTGLDENQFMDTLVDWTGRSSMYMSLLLTAIYVPVVRWVVPGWRARYNIAETFVFGIYTMAHATLLCLPLYGVPYLFSDLAVGFGITSLLTVLVLALYTSVSAVRFHGRGWTTFLMAMLTYLFTYVAFSLVGGIVGMAAAILVSR